VDFAARHTAAARQFAERTGRTAVPHESSDRYVRRHNELQEQDKQLFADRPYTWGDHWHWYLQSPRREYHG
jgi:hypothetical protein